VPAVDRIVGPGNAYVAQAKLQVLGSVAIDAPAGPSELLIIADESADPRVLAREVMAQAEHDPQAAVVIVAIEDAEARPVSSGVMREVRQLLRADVGDVAPRRDIIMESLRSRGALLSASCAEQAVDVANEYAAEHVLLAVREPDALLARLRSAGTVFLGQTSSVAFGDYMTGANHVLPTGGLARCYSGLSPLDFVRWTTYQRVSRDAAARLAGDVALFAAAEGLPAHAAAANAWSVS
jgi:histidinol dehydrogenase